MIEILLGLVFTGVLGGGIFTIIQRGVTSRRFHYRLEVPAPEPRRMVLGSPVQLAIEAPREIPEDIRRELDESYEMSRDTWDREFHASLNSSSSREVLAILPTYAYNGEHRSDNRVLKDCTCADCTSA